MELVEKVKKDRIEAMASRDRVKRAVLDMVLSAAQANAKSANRSVPSDQDVTSALQRELKTARKNADDARLPEEARASANAEADIISSYLPKMLDERELSEAISASGLTSVQDVMRHLEATFPGAYDRALAARIAKAVAK